MAVLRWMAVTLALLMSAENSQAVVDQNQLATIVNGILRRYRPSYIVPGGSQRSPMFSLAVSIPYNSKTKKYDVNQVPDSAERVRNTIINCEVYRGTRVVAATLLKWPDVVSQCPNGRVPQQWSINLNNCQRQITQADLQTWADVDQKCPAAIRRGRADHAEYRTLQDFNTWANDPSRDRSDLLLFYVYASPCASRCANSGDTRNILNWINPILNWPNYAFVFSKVFRPRQGDPIPVEDLQEALMQLGTYQGELGPIGLNNIFRCDRERGRIVCTSCSTGGQVTHKCVADSQQQGPSHPYLKIRYRLD